MMLVTRTRPYVISTNVPPDAKPCPPTCLDFSINDIKRGARGNGQGKLATTILAEQGDIVHVIADAPYTVRSKHAPVSPRKGSRAMHRSTLIIPTQKESNYQTSSKTFFGGRQDLVVEPRPPQYPSQHTSQWDFNSPADTPWDTHYNHQFPTRWASAPAKIHWPTYVNKMSNNEGKDMKNVMVMRERENQPSYFSQYNRVHNKLGAILGPGVGREYPVREKYNILTGEERGPAWNPENRRVSGNRVLYQNHRKDADKHFVLG